MAAGARFQQDRKDWASDADPLVEKCYKEYYGITDADIYPVETLVHDVHDRAGGYDSHQILDYGGLDKIVDAGSRLMHISERVRPHKSTADFKPDMSLRVDNGVHGRHAEVTKWVTAYDDHGYSPSIFAYGIYTKDKDTLEEFYLVDTEPVIKALAKDVDIGVVKENVESNDGTKARYITADQLRDLDAIIAEWHDITPAYEPDIDSDQQSTGGVTESGQRVQERLDWPVVTDELATQCYVDYYGVEPRNVYSVAELVESVHDKETGEATRQALHAGGLDTVIDCGTRHIYVAEQWQHSKYTPHRLTLCTDNNDASGLSMLDSWLAAYVTTGYYPSVIAFGVYDDFLKVFSEFYLLDAEVILQALVDEPKPGTVWTKEDGCRDRCFTIGELQELGAVLAEWNGVGRA